MVLPTCMAFAGSVGQPTPFTDQSWSGVLQAPLNAIEDCSPATLHVGGQLHIRLRRASPVAEFRIQRIDGSRPVDVLVRPHVRQPEARFRLPALGNRRVVQFNVSGLRGIADGANTSPVRVFERSGSYAVLFGYGFRSSDESEIVGVCVVRFSER